ncbi:barstar family protein [Patescibacteria group bacterium]|nr:barstar family protein [Patescibacteria group bacterium]
MELTWKELLSIKEGKFYLVSSRERDIDIFKDKLSSDKPDIVVRFFRGSKCRSKESLYQEFAAALQFPYYAVDQNWDGFDEGINDLNWLPANKYVMIITNFNEVLSDNHQDLDIFMDILKDTISNWTKETRNNIPNQTPVAFTIILHCRPDEEKNCMEILKKENIQPVLRILKPYDDIL